MKVTLYGATGAIGSRILNELLSRGHSVTAVARDISKLNPKKGLTAKTGNAEDPRSVAETAKGSDAVISAYSPGFETPQKLVDTVKSLIAGLKQAGVKRFLMVGGAAGLEVAPGVLVIDSPDFPAAWKPIAQAHIDALKVLRTADLDWTYFSPAALIAPGQRTGNFRLGTNRLLADSKGVSQISAEDYAIAMVDELEKGRHIRERFTAAY